MYDEEHCLLPNDQPASSSGYGSSRLTRFFQISTRRVFEQAEEDPEALPEIFSIRQGARALRDAFGGWRKQFLDLQPLIWPAGLEVCKGSIYVLVALFISERALTFLIPHTFGLFVQQLNAENGSGANGFVLLLSWYLCQYSKINLIPAIQQSFWLDIALKSEDCVTGGIFRRVYDRLEYRDIWTSGAFLSDFNKGTSLNKCLQISIYDLLPILFDILVATIDIWLELGLGYGASVAVLSFGCVGYVICNSRHNLHLSQMEVQKKRAKDSEGKEQFAALAMVSKDAATKNIQAFDQCLKIYLAQKRQTQLEWIIQTAIIVATFMIVYSSVLLFAFCKVHAGRLDARQFILLLTYMTQLLRPISALSASAQKFLSSLADSQRTITWWHLDKEKMARFQRDANATKLQRRMTDTV